MQDEDVSKSKMQKRKSSAQTPPVGQLQAYNEAWQEDAPKVPKSSQKSQKAEIPLKRFEPSRSPQDSGLPESSPLTVKPGNDYRALRRKYLLLEEEGFALREELEQVDADVKKLEEEKFALLDELVVLEGLVEPPSTESPRQKISG